MFEQDKIDAINEFYRTYPRAVEIIGYRKLRDSVGSVKNLFYGDSITACFPFQEFFPNHSILNRGIPGDNVYGLHIRAPEDVFPYSPKRVFMMIGINGIEEPAERIIAHIIAVADEIRARNIDVVTCSILPLRSPDNWNRFQYQGKIVEINAALRESAHKRGGVFLDYHSALKDETGQLAAPYAQPDGTHVTFDAYCRMAEIVRPHLVK